jgi:hypothetical protein
MVLAIAVAACLGWLAWCVARADADIGPPFGPDRLIASMDPAALPADAADRAWLALRDRPIDGRAYRVLAQVAEQDGYQAKAAELYAIAARRWPRERLAQAKLAEMAFTSGNPAIGITHLDALLRVAPDARGPVLEALLPAMADPKLRAAMVQRLQLAPPWRSTLSHALLAKTAPPETALSLLAGMAEAGPLSAAEVQARVDLLDRTGQHPLARTAWLESLEEHQHDRQAPLFDGGFEHPEVSGGYGWRWRAPPGVAMGMEALAPLEGKRAMSLQFEGRAVRFDDLAQYLALPPGRYALSASADNRVRSRRAFVWEIRCSEGGRLLLELPLSMEDGWQAVRSTFSVPEGCSRQELRLRHTGRSLAERQMRGTLRLDAMAVTELP